ncbi:MAG: hypothetical protein GX175_05125 [Halanaerobiaceae bacterium]|nr:hypothetical protein [Halanaerobiaceae bacterium]
MKILSITLKLFLFTGKFLVTLPSLYLRRRQGVRAFSRELIISGIDKETTRELAKEYKKCSSVFRSMFSRENIFKKDDH